MRNILTAWWCFTGYLELWAGRILEPKLKAWEWTR